MNGRGISSPYLWMYKRLERKVKELTIDIEYLEELSNYERGVCAFCPQLLCSIEKTEECYKNFIERGK